MGYNIALKTIGTVPNFPLASATGKEPHPPILSMIAIHGGQVKRDFPTFKPHNHIFDKYYEVFLKLHIVHLTHNQMLMQ